MALFGKKKNKDKDWELGQDSSVPYQVHLNEEDDDDDDPGIVNKLYDSFPVSDSKVTLEKSEKENANYTAARGEGFAGQEEISAQFSTFQEVPEVARHSPPPKTTRRINCRIVIAIVIILAVVAVIAIAVPLSMSLNKGSESPKSEQQTGHNKTVNDKGTTATPIPTVVLQGQFSLLAWSYAGGAKTNSKEFQNDFCTEVTNTMTMSSDESIKSIDNCKVEVKDSSRRDKRSAVKDVTFSMQFHPKSEQAEADADILSSATGMLKDTFDDKNQNRKFEIDSSSWQFDGDEGKLCDSNPCRDPLQNCAEIPFSYKCKCPPGYDSTNNGIRCTDIDECKTDKSHGCSHHCVNTKGSFTCACNSGYELDTDNKSCKDKNECKDDNGGCAHNCTNTEGSYECSCLNGYKLANDSRRCVDIDECEENLDSCSQNCANTMGSFMCVCNTGYVLAPDGKSCNDINECLSNNGDCSNGCDNNDGSYSCTCEPGYKLLTDARTCGDIDECEEIDNGCSQNCSNSEGSYSCTCMDGYLLNQDGKSCADINECSISDICSQLCTNTPGNYSCSCFGGYRYDQSTGECVDQDECTTNTNNCNTSDVCVNTVGSFACISHDLGMLCPMILISGDNYFQHMRQGFYKLTTDECSEQPVWINDRSNPPAYLYYFAGPWQNNSMWMAGGTKCSSYVGLKTKEYHPLPYSLTPGNWMVAFGGTWHESTVESTCLWGSEQQCEAPGDHGHPCSHICDKLDTGYVCDCQRGYKLHSDDHTCFDIDECLNPDPPCGDNDYCLNTEGGYTCASEDEICPELYFHGTYTEQNWRYGTYRLSPDLKCYGRPVWLQGNNYLFYSNQTKFWNIGSVPCSTYAGVFAESRGRLPYDIELGKWKIWTGSVWQTEEVGMTCTGSNCPAEFECGQGGVGGSDCIGIWEVCDSYKDCDDFSDERNCPCDDVYFKCADGVCLSGFYNSMAVDWCNGEAICPDGSDEPEGCECRADQYQCPSSGKCIPLSHKCDGGFDCDDQSDEKDCVCADYETKCDNGLCKPQTYRCDGDNDCGDWSDESNCTCSVNQRKCDDGTCVRQLQWCDGNPDCRDGSDEKQGCVCPTVNFFQCASGECIDRRSHCDLIFDCPDQSDEMNCTCPLTYHHCDNGNCIHPLFTCDGDDDCGDKSDETKCPCRTDSFKCDSGDCPGGAVEDVYCDGVHDCNDKSDEKANCSATCRDNQFMCDGKCINTYRFCDGIFDCEDKTDEIHANCNCNDYQQLCNTGLCLYNSTFCNGKNDCGDWSDETSCECNYLQTKCASGMCIAKYKWCDGNVDCNDGSDETEDCTCLDSQFACDDGTCIDEDWTCDGYPHCPNGTDEYPALRCQCDENKWRCDDGQCIPSHYKCDDWNDCFDRSDERNCTCDSEASFKCDDGYCLPLLYVCDGMADCDDSSDERDCACEKEHEVRCGRDIGRCIHQDWVCDGIVDCRHGEDESDCRRCNSTDFVCGNYECIPASQQCDGTPQCSDHTDEMNCVRGAAVLIEGSEYHGVYARTGRGWAPVCAPIWGQISDAVADAMCKQLGHGDHQAIMRRPVGDSQVYAEFKDESSSKADSIERIHQALTFQSGVCTSRQMIMLSCKERACGERSNNITVSGASSFVVKGETSSRGTWPWMAAIVKPPADDMVLLCGATLIADQWVVTAAHCFQNIDLDNINDLGWGIRLGSTRIRYPETDAILGRISKVILHPRYSSPHYNYDIALIKLLQPVQHTDYIRPACLPEPDLNLATLRKCYISGWGSVRVSSGFLGPYPGETQEQLHEGRMNILSTKRCEDSSQIEQINNIEFRFDNHTMMCAGYLEDHTSACYGDSGGPLMCEDENRKWVLTGVINSAGEACNTYNVFAKVQFYTQWILDTMFRHNVES